MSDREEELVNEFEEAYQQQDYARLAEMIRFIRSEVRRDSRLADRVPTRELFELLATEDEMLAGEIRWLLGDLLERVDVASILSTFGPILETALQPDSRKEVLHLGLDFMAKAAAAAAGKSGKGDLPTTKWKMLVQLLSHEDVSIADRVAKIISSSSGELRSCFMREIGKIKGSKSEEMDDTMRVRLLALQVRMKVPGGGWEEVKQLLEKAVSADDPLLLMSTLQIVQEECSDAEVMEHCNAAGVISQVGELAKDEGLENFLRARAVVTLACIFRTPCPAITTVVNDIRPLDIINQLLGNDDNSLLAATLLLFGVLCANEAVPEIILQTLLEHPALYQLILNSDLQLQEAFHATIAIVFGAAPRRLQSVFYRRLFAATATHPITLLIERAPSTLSESLKLSAYDALSALLRHDWVVKDAVATTGLINFLLERSSDRSMLGLQRKYDLVRQLSSMSVIEDSIRGQLRAYLSQGISYSRAAPTLATQNR